MNTEQTALFSEAPVRKAVLTLAIPTVISQLITVVYNMADTFFHWETERPAASEPEIRIRQGIARPFVSGRARRWRFSMASPGQHPLPTG